MPHIRSEKRPGRARSYATPPRPGRGRSRRRRPLTGHVFGTESARGARTDHGRRRHDRLAHRRPGGRAGGARDRRPRRLRARPPREPGLGDGQRQRRDRRGRHPRRGARARADARHRRRLPPGRDPHHAVRGGAAPGARGPRRRHLQRRRGRRAGGRAQARRRLVGLGLRPRRGVPHDARTTTRTPTTRSTARPRSSTRACCAASRPCRTSTTSPCATSTSTAPRMDVHGLYTEVLVRWMERIEAGEPPLIFGDGLQTMDFVYVGDIARANILAANSDADRRGLQRRQRRRDQPARAGRGAAAGDGLRPLGRSTARRAPSTASPAAWPTRRAARERLGFDAEVGLLEGLTRLVSWWRVERELADSRAGEGVADGGPVRPPLADRGRRRRRRRGRRLRLGLAGPARRRLRGRLRRARGRARRGRHDQLHHGAAPRALRVRRRARRRGHRPVAVVHRHGQRRLAVRRDAGLRRHRPADLQPRPGVGRARDHRAHEGDHARAPGRAAGGHGRLPRAGRALRARARRGRRLRHRRALQGPADRLARARWPASRCTRARSSPPARAA